MSKNDSASETDKKFGKIIFRIRRTAWPIIESGKLAKAIGIGRSQYSRKENGHIKFTLTEVVKICSALGIKNIAIDDLNETPTTQHKGDE